MKKFQVIVKGFHILLPIILAALVLASLVMNTAWSYELTDEECISRGDFAHFVARYRDLGLPRKSLMISEGEEMAIFHEIADAVYSQKYLTPAEHKLKFEAFCKFRKGKFDKYDLNWPCN